MKVWVVATVSIKSKQEGDTISNDINVGVKVFESLEKAKKQCLTMPETAENITIKKWATTNGEFEDVETYEYRKGQFWKMVEY